jgi:hypothetical protein
LIGISQAQIKADTQNVEILDEWACEEYTCAIAKDNKKNILLLIIDKNGVLVIFQKGLKVWERKDI